ncbi:YtxH domain-containing protein [Terriglobus sp. TAA 43]|uniref:YtxH domain-containing protein n=1 Tax=Terriglobus sp. TAA 43 TaxID=278961 RepID=UPI00068FB73D|nr:YtxH domain-containing protein [Terriglobus sp. TAA 43]
MNNKSFWAAFITGLTVGAVVALVYAPHDGKTTRKKIGRAYGDAEDALEDAADYVKDRAERLSKEASHAYKKGVKQLDEVYSKASDALDDIYSEAKDRLASAADSAIDGVETASKKVRAMV